jgi:peptide deformylase
MAVRSVVCYPDERLRKKCRPVKHVDEQVVKLAEDMAETMYSGPGVGLAAPQVGVNRRVIVVHAYQEEGDLRSRLLAVVNPEIVEASPEVEVADEGCLCLPGVRADVVRAVRVVVQGLDLAGQPVRHEVTEFEARVFQHEIDHLDGMLFIDRLDSLTREMLLKEYLEAQKAGAAPAKSAE